LYARQNKNLYTDIRVLDPDRQDLHESELAMTIPQEFFTLQSMLTLTGAAGATFVVCNGLQSAFNFNPRWLALVVAQCLSVYGTYASHSATSVPSDYFVAVVNGFLIYATATGGTNILGGSAAPAVARGAADAAAPQAGSRRGFLSSWF
jgi:hypothetical protein